MIRIRALGSIGKRLGSETFTLDRRSVKLTEAVRVLYGLKEEDCSEALSNILIAVNGVAISHGFAESVLESGDEVTLIPISHGG